MSFAFPTRIYLALSLYLELRFSTQRCQEAIRTCIARVGKGRKAAVGVTSPWMELTNHTEVRLRKDSLREARVPAVSQLPLCLSVCTGFCIYFTSCIPYLKSLRGVFYISEYLNTHSWISWRSNQCLNRNLIYFHIYILNAA